MGLGIVQNESDTSKVDRSMKLGTNMSYGALIVKHVQAQKKFKMAEKSKMAAVKYYILHKLDSKCYNL